MGEIQKQEKNGYRQSGIINKSSEMFSHYRNFIGMLQGFHQFTYNPSFTEYI